MSSIINVTYQELTTILEITPHDQNILLCGDHGVGKSQILTAYYEAQDFEVVPLFLGQMSDAGDLLGLPKEKKLTTGQVETLVMDFLPPHWWQTEKRFCLFLDEINRGRPEIAQVIFDLALNKKLGGRKLPEGSVIVGAANVGDEYQVTELDPALISRFNVYRLAPTVDEWLGHATSEKVDNRITSFIAANHDQLDPKMRDDADSMDKSPDRRAWFKVNEMLQNLPNYMELVHIKAISGVIGQSTAGMFNKHIKSMSTVDAKTVFLARNWKKVSIEMQMMKMDEFFHLNKQLLSYIKANYETIQADEKIQDTCCRNFLLYVNELESMEYREPIAEIINKLETHKEAGAILLSDEDVYEAVDKFVDSVEVKL
tara:strand:- start:366 stop:1478 length:1113 start_codon:yes stop_codon:yes gene_type:complete